MMTLYQREECAASHSVREVMTRLGITYVAVNVHPDPAARDELRDFAPDGTIPCLVDGERILTRAAEIIAYLEGQRVEEQGPGEAIREP